MNRILLTFLEPVHIEWTGYPELDVDDTDPVLPYDHYHHMWLQFHFDNNFHISVRADYMRARVKLAALREERQIMYRYRVMAMGEYDRWRNLAERMREYVVLDRP